MLLLESSESSEKVLIDNSANSAFVVLAKDGETESTEVTGAMAPPR